MILDGLNKIKQQSIMTAIMLIAAGLIIVIWPGDYIITLMKFVSAILLIWAMIMVLNYTQSKKSFMDYIRLIAALILGILGLWIMVFDVSTMDAISWVFGILLAIDGLHSCLHALIYSRRSHRKGWWILIPISLVLIALGVLTIIHPWWDNPEELLHVIGWMIVGAAVSAMLRLIWIWPLKDIKEAKA